MKKLILKLIVMAVIIAPGVADAQNQIARPSKKKTEQATGTKPSKQSPAKQNNATMSKAERDAILQNLINNMEYVEGGSFLMGADDNDKDARPWEKPAHLETVNPFSIGKYEVTQKEWEAVMMGNPSYFKGDNLPVENVSWDDCLLFIEKLNTLTGKNFRLPTEEEWEYAARGGNLSNGYKYSGSNDINSVAWYFDNSGGKTHAVGAKKSNELGLHDMSGNVKEWTSSKYCDDYNEPRDSSLFVFRGGCFSNYPGGCRVSERDRNDATLYVFCIGFRLAH